MDSETRRINKNPNALKRGLACFTCRRRKMKCDAVKPACSPCIKSRQQCVYPEIGSDDKPDGNQGIKRKNKVKDLEDKIQRLEGDLARSRGDLMRPSTAANGLMGDVDIGINSAKLILDAAALSTDYQFSDTSLGIPGWHPDYPSLDLTMHLLNTFFNACPIVASFLHKPTFMQRATLPYSHPDAPPSALMHAIFCSASRHSPRTTNPVTVPRRDQCHQSFTAFTTPCSTFLEVHAQLAAQAIEKETVSDNSLNRKAEAVKALIVMSHFMHIEDKWADHFRINAMSIRGTVALRLHLDMEMTPNRALLTPPKNDIERECRKFTFFLAYLFDTLYSSISSIYPSNIRDDEIFTKLPIKTSDYNNLTPSQSIAEYNQHIDDEHFFTEHEADGFHFVIKSTVLLARVNGFKHVSQRDVIRQGVQSANQLQSFAELDSLIMTYRASVPDSWGDSVQIIDGGLDIGIYLAHLVGIKAMMSLHSGFIHDQFSKKRLMSCARIIMSTIYRLLGTSWDLCKLPSYVISIYNDASDILIAAHLQSTKSRDYVSAESIKLELSTIAEVYRRMSERIPVALTALRKLHNKFEQNSIPVKICEEEMEQLRMAQPVFNSQATQATSQFDHTDFNDALIEQLAFEANTTSTNTDSVFNQEYQMQYQLPNFGIAPGTAFTARDEFRWMNMDESGDPFNSSSHAIDGLF